MMSKNVREEPLRSVIQNCRRLIKDAELLLENGSAGSALSLAIMAFEEAGKGHSHELDAKHHRKRGKIPSSHQFRHVISAIVLWASLHQKHGLQSPEFTEEQREKIAARYDAASSFSEFASSPAPDEVRSIIGRQIFEKLDALPKDQRTIAYVEINWLRKIAKASATGEVERLRQKGFYVDFDERNLLSRPMEVTKREADAWIWTAKRAVNLLAFGIYYQPYSELAALLEAMPRPLPEAEEILKMTFDMVRGAAKTVEEAEQQEWEAEMVPYEPFGEPPS